MSVETERHEASMARLYELPAEEDRPSWWEAEADRLADEKAAEERASRKRRRVNGWTMRTGF